jgi:T4 bacteriophage base plate protein
MNNPLRQYFRRPALHLSLPSKGQFYPEGSIDMPETGELPIYPMTAIDEITSKTPDALFNGSAVVDIIKSCVPAIKDPWAIPSMDLDAILIAIRSATNGNDLDITSTCPSCENEGEYKVNLSYLLTTIKSDNYDNVLHIGELQVKFKPLSYKEVNDGNMGQFLMQRQIREMQAMDDADEAARNKRSSELMKDIQKINAELICNTVESISVESMVVTNREHLTEFIEKCDRNTYEAIRTHVTTIRTNSTIKPQKIICVNCSHEYNQELALNISDFFG